MARRTGKKGHSSANFEQVSNYLTPQSLFSNLAHASFCQLA